MTVYKGHRVALRVVHSIWVDNEYGVVIMRCGETTARAAAYEHITSEPLSCLWCIAGLRRFSPGGFE